MSSSITPLVRLVIFVPFPRRADNEKQSDVQQIIAAIDAQCNPQAYTTVIADSRIDELVVVYSGEQANQIRQGDIVLVNAHGGDDDFYDLTDNSGGSQNMQGVLDMLVDLGAANASEAIFYCCFSSQPDHIARCYKAAYPDQSVWGTPEACKGNAFFKAIGGRGSVKTLKFTAAVWREHKGLEECT